MTSSSQMHGGILPPRPRSLDIEGRRGVAPDALRALVAVFDALVVALALLGATAIADAEATDVAALPRQIATVAALVVLGLAIEGAYDLKRIRNGHQLLSRLGLGLAVGLGLVGLASYVLPQVRIGRAAVVLLALFAAPLLVVWRRFLFHALRGAALRSRAVVLGEEALARKVAGALARAEICGAEVVGILTPRGAPAGATPADDEEFARRREWVREVVGLPPTEGRWEIARLGGYDRLVDVARRYHVQQAIVVSGPHDDALPVDDLIALREAGLSVEDGSAAYEAVTGKLLVEKLTPSWLVFANAFERSHLEKAFRRALGIVVAGAALLVLSPFLALVALAVKLDSPGPVFFRQERVGERGRRFMLTKFRTMRADAEAKSGPVWAQAHDPRVTKLGRILRSTRIDELPQLWNVLAGDMYFVGPRPERPHFVDLLRAEVPHYDQRHAVKPGITGWAQINYRYGASVEDSVEKLHYDLFYIQNRSTLLDLYVVLGTIRVMLGASNAN